MPELWEMAATELAALVQAGKASCREVVHAHLDRISQVNQLLNAVTVPLAEKALTAAEAADRAFSRGEPSGPLSGVPMTVKENIDVAGSATTLGIAPLRDAVASHDAPHIGELRAAGAIPVGRTNMPEFGMRWHTVSALRGATLNPWSARHTPGGSSGGDAAAVASGMVPLGMGNDGAGSLRWPAACCGVAALQDCFSGFPAVDFRGSATEGNVMTELWTLAACDLARLVGEREVSAREVVQAHLDRIGQVNPTVNAVTAVLDGDALEAADAADAALLRGEEAGPLCGVPMTVKENIDVAGFATTLGIAALRDAVARRDAPHVGELRAAGAIPVGRGNMPEFGMRWHTVSVLRGATRNPWSARHTPGGSSGGDAAAVASGMVPLGMGNDGAGSLRWPAACCGVTALKPSFGRVSQGGHQEPPHPAPFAFQLLGRPGADRRHVRDLRLAFRTCAGVRGATPGMPRPAGRPGDPGAAAGLGHHRPGASRDQA